MSDLTGQMRKVARELLEKGEVNYVIGWEKGTFPHQSPPFFARTPEDAERLVWDEYCVNNLAIYLLDDRYGDSKIGLFVKGCDSRGVVRILQDKQFPRERVYLIGIPCPGLKDPARALHTPPGQAVPPAPKCEQCNHHNPVLYDVLLGEPVAEPAVSVAERFASVAELEAMNDDDRYEFWARQYDRCIRCFACRNVCPACNCTVCCFDLPRVGWLAKLVDRANNQFYGLTRALHVAGRCIECGECERACPMDIPIMRLNRKLIKDVNELFGTYEAGLDLEQLPPLGRYSLDDPEEFR